MSRAPTEVAVAEDPARAAAPTVQHGVAEHPSPAPNPEGDKRYPESMATAELPDGGPFTERGTGRWSIVPGTTDRVGPDVPVRTYSVEVEEGVALPGGPQGFAATVHSVLSHPKSWIGSGDHAFQRVANGDADLRVSLTSQMTTRKLCGFAIPYDGSCWRGDLRRVIINTARWERGAVVFQGNIVAYQQYLINHEVGHALNFDHVPCPANGELAPVMMQQTWGTSNNYLADIGTDRVAADGKNCLANPWPFPRSG
ncbi:DUF3152 domain-containing protein [Actinophytocola sp. NPDC049390]|uniref:DUF3152 domain-containing protein n=1 Tax=Actinophytocola sp. NPDC049390 TaxID=3363894 RepID=UPI0037929A4E